MARYILDTNIFVFYAEEKDRLNHDVSEILNDYGNSFCMSSESIKELVVAHSHKGLFGKKWKNHRTRYDFEYTADFERQKVSVL